MAEFDDGRPGIRGGGVRAAGELLARLHQVINVAQAGIAPARPGTASSRPARRRHSRLFNSNGSLARALEVCRAETMISARDELALWGWHRHESLRIV